MCIACVYYVCMLTFFSLLDVQGHEEEEEETTLFISQPNAPRPRLVEKKLSPDASPPMPLFSQPHISLDLTRPSDHLRSSLPPQLIPQSPFPLEAAYPPVRKRRRANEVSLLELPNFEPFNATRRQK